MSIEVMTRVWKQSPQKGSALLLVVALADNANDYGYCWPGTRYLAEKIRMSERQTIRLLDKLVEAGEIFRYAGEGGRGICNRFVVLTGLNETEIRKTLRMFFSVDELPESDLNQFLQTLTEKRCQVVQKGDILSRKGDKLSKKGDTITLKSAQPYEPSIEPSIESGVSSQDATTTRLAQKVSDSEASKPEEPPSKVAQKVSPAPRKKPERNPWSALTDALHNALPDGIRPSKPHYAANNEPAKTLYNEGYTPERITAFVQATYPSYRRWAESRDKPPLMTMHHVERHIRGWEATHKPEPTEAERYAEWKRHDDELRMLIGMEDVDL